MYFPQKNTLSPASYGLHNFSELSLTAKDSTNIAAWYHKADIGYPTIIYFHGNGGNLGNRAEYFQLLSSAGFGVLAIDYRGYGNSSGTPSEQGLYADARTVINYAANDLLLNLNNVIFYGESLGTGIAIQMATEYKNAALILQSPYSSISEIASSRYSWLPVRLLLKDKFDSISKIGQLKSPLLVFHGEKDSVVPVRSGRALFAKAPQPKESVFFPDINHNNFNLETLTNYILEFCRKYRLIEPQNSNFASYLETASSTT